MQTSKSFSSDVRKNQTRNVKKDHDHQNELRVLRKVKPTEPQANLKATPTKRKMSTEKRREFEECSSNSNTRSLSNKGVKYVNET
jgi:hypothetical protein